MFTNSEIKLYKTEDNKITVPMVLSQITKSKEVLAYLPDVPADYANNKEYLFAIVNTID